ncbi:hypothetical protein WJX81_007303, partial [Elliptochloris bilobata]
MCAPAAIANFLTLGYDYSVSIVPLTGTQYKSANRSIIQVPFVLSIYAVAHTIPGTNFQAPPCVQRASVWTGVLAKLNTTPYAIGYIEYKHMLKSNLTSVALRNAAGAYMAPGFQQTAVPPASLPPSLASPDWERVQLTSSSSYPFVGLIYLITNQDIVHY